MSGSGIVLVADTGPMQLGSHLVEAVSTLGLTVTPLDTREAFDGPAVLRTASWRLAGHRPLRLANFSARVLEVVRRERPSIVLATGLAPLQADVLREIGTLGAKRINFLTDDPWNPAHRAPWFLKGLPSYDIVFSPRHANLDDLIRAGVPRVEYLPFGYSPVAHRYEPATTAAERAAFHTDVVLAGGADEERARLVQPLIRAGLSVALYGGYWDRFPSTRRYAKGVLGAEGLRKVTAEARISLGLVRRANRDGHAMRTFEVPAMRGCLLAERTSDHVALFGSDREAVVYFDDAADVVDAARWILDHPLDRDRLAAQASEVVRAGRHTYADRLAAMLEAAA
ncbi:MAG: glycosyltransferase [Acidobacteriota bacterium]